MRRGLTVLAFVALCFAPPVMAQSTGACLTAADAQSGIRLTRQSPLFDMVLRKDGLLVTEDRTAINNGTKRRVITTYLHGLVPLLRRDGASKIESKLGASQTGFVVKGRVKNWSSPVTIWVNGNIYGTGKISVRRVGNATWKGSGCTYKVQRVIVSTRLEGKPPSHFEYYFSTKLGVSLGGFKLDPDGRTRVSSVLPERISRK